MNRRGGSRSPAQQYSDDFDILLVMYFWARAEEALVAVTEADATQLAEPQ